MALWKECARCYGDIPFVNNEIFCQDCFPTSENRCQSCGFLCGENFCLDCINKKLVQKCRQCLKYVLSFKLNVGLCTQCSTKKGLRLGAAKTGKQFDEMASYKKKQKLTASGIQQAQIPPPFSDSDSSEIEDDNEDDAEKLGDSDSEESRANSSPIVNNKSLAQHYFSSTGGTGKSAKGNTPDPPTTSEFLKLLDKEKKEKVGEGVKRKKPKSETKPKAKSEAAKPRKRNSKTDKSKEVADNFFKALTELSQEPNFFIDTINIPLRLSRNVGM